MPAPRSYFVLLDTSPGLCYLGCLPFLTPYLPTPTKCTFQDSQRTPSATGQMLGATLGSFDVVLQNTNQLIA